MTSYLGTKEVICPYCDYKDPESWRFEEGTQDVNCQNCGKDFFLDVTTYTRFYTFENRDEL